SQNVVIKLIAINVVVHIVSFIIIGLIGLGGRQVAVDAYNGFVSWLWLPGDIGTFITRPWTLITHFFLHTRGFSHLFWNMLFLLWFGRIFQNLMGNARTLALYLFAGLCGGVAFMLFSQVIPIMSTSSVMAGASGAVTAIVVGAATLTPNYEIRLMFFGNIKIWWIAAFQVIADLVYLSANNTGGHFAHLTGALVGYLYVTQLQKGTDIADWTVNVMNFFGSAFKRSPKQPAFKVHRNERANSNNSSKKTPFKEVSQEEIDAILDKISKSGYDSLTAKEKEILFKANK
ncbi:MAG: rhomboid family intramembrane serine protease, partial [Bacteroidetes bacterium]|nr:rhomboid family intramembrane serine protease [Bacteroidota bacterium]